MKDTKEFTKTNIMYCYHWQDGQAGNANIVTYNGEDIVGVMYVEDEKLRKIIIEKHNDYLKRSIDEYMRISKWLS